MSAPCYTAREVTELAWCLGAAVGLISFAIGWYAHWKATQR